MLPEEQNSVYYLYINKVVMLNLMLDFILIIILQTSFNLINKVIL
jgi:hypothetical protein